MGYGRGSTGKRYRIVPPEGVTGLLEPWQRRIPTWFYREDAKVYAEKVFRDMNPNDIRPVAVFLGKDKVGEWTVNGWVEA